MFPHGLFLGMVTPLYLIHFDLASTGEANVFLEDMDWPLAVGQVMVKVNGIFINLLESLGLVRNLETLMQLGDMKNIVEFGQLRG
jgi:hypothetical protein